MRVKFLTMMISRIGIGCFSTTKNQIAFFILKMDMNSESTKKYSVKLEKCKTFCQVAKRVVAVQCKFSALAPKMNWTIS